MYNEGLNPNTPETGGNWLVTAPSATGTPAVINCGPAAGTGKSVCTATYPLNTIVILTAQPRPGVSFGGWSSNCNLPPFLPRVPNPTGTQHLHDQLVERATPPWEPSSTNKQAQPRRRGPRFGAAFLSVFPNRVHAVRSRFATPCVCFVILSTAKTPSFAIAVAFLLSSPKGSCGSPCRVPHPSQSHREGWDANRPASLVAVACSTLTSQERPGAPSFAVPSRRVGCETVRAPPVFAVAVEIEPGFSPASNRAPTGATALPEHGRGDSEAEGEATDLIAFVFALIFFLQIQPKNRMSSPKTTQNHSKHKSYKWHFSYPQFAILKTVEKRNVPPNPKTITPLFAQI